MLRIDHGRGGGGGSGRASRHVRKVCKESRGDVMVAVTRKLGVKEQWLDLRSVLKAASTELPKGIDLRFETNV